MAMAACGIAAPLPSDDADASSGAIVVSLVHTHPHNETSVEIELRGAGEIVRGGGGDGLVGWLLTAKSSGAFNSEAAPDAVAPVPLPPASVVAMGKHRLRVSLPPRSLVVLELRATHPPAV